MLPTVLLEDRRIQDGQPGDAARLEVEWDMWVMSLSAKQKGERVRKGLGGPSLYIRSDAPAGWASRKGPQPLTLRRRVGDTRGCTHNPRPARGGRLRYPAETAAPLNNEGTR